jgi:hypothetical protein
MNDIFFYDLGSGTISFLLFVINFRNWLIQLDSSPPLYKLYNKVISLSCFLIFLSSIRSVYFSEYTLYIYQYSIDLSSIIFILGMIKNDQIIIDIMKAIELNNSTKLNNYFLLMKYTHYLLYFMETIFSLVMIVLKTIYDNVKYMSFVGFNNCLIIFIILICLNSSLYSINKLYNETSSVFIKTGLNPLQKFKYYQYGYNFMGIISVILLFYSSFYNLKYNNSLLEHSKKLSFSPYLILAGCIIANCIFIIYDKLFVKNDIKARSNRIYTFQSSNIDKEITIV